MGKTELLKVNIVGTLCPVGTRSCSNYNLWEKLNPQLTLVWDYNQFISLYGAPSSPWLCEDVLIKALLSAGQTALEDVLVLLRQLLLHIPFGAPQNEGLNHLHLRVSVWEFHMQQGCGWFNAYNFYYGTVKHAEGLLGAIPTLCRRMTNLWQ